MRQLLAKDLRLVAPYAWVVVPVHVLWCAQAFLAPHLYFWLSLAASLGWTVAILGIEWHSDTARFVGSLPVSRAAVVKARYVSALGGLGLGAALYVIYGHLYTAFLDERLTAVWGSAPAWASVGGVGAFLAVGCTILLGFLPFYFRFGLAGGAAAFGASATPVAALYLALRPSVPWPLVVALLAALGLASVRLSVRFHSLSDL